MSGSDMEQIYRDYAQMVYRYLLSLTHDAELAEEITQETFYRAIRSIHRFDGSSKLSTWLCQIKSQSMSGLESWKRGKSAKRKHWMNKFPPPHLWKTLWYSPMKRHGFTVPSINLMSR